METGSSYATRNIRPTNTDRQHHSWLRKPTAWPVLCWRLIEIPGSHLVHGHVFPLGMRPRTGSEFGSIEEAVAHFQQLAKTDVFKQASPQP